MYKNYQSEVPFCCKGLVQQTNKHWWFFCRNYSNKNGWVIYSKWWFPSYDKLKKNLENKNCKGVWRKQTKTTLRHSWKFWIWIRILFSFTWGENEKKYWIVDNIKRIRFSAKDATNAERELKSNNIRGQFQRRIQVVIMIIMMFIIFSEGSVEIRMRLFYLKFLLFNYFAIFYANLLV